METYIIYGLCITAFLVGCYLTRRPAGRLTARASHLMMAHGGGKRALKQRIDNLQLIKKRKKEKTDREICEGIALLRNMIAVDKGAEVSSDFIITMLSEQKGMLSPVYKRMLALLRVNRRKDAMELFSQAADTTIGKEFAILLIQWDQLPPKELAEVLLSHQKNIKEVQITLQKRRDETISDFIYLPVVLNLFLIFINFIYVSYFIEQREMFQMLF